jgi:hypothetical protein
MWGVAKVRSKVRVTISIDDAASRKSSNNSTQFAMLSSSSSNPATFNQPPPADKSRLRGLAFVGSIVEEEQILNHPSLRSCFLTLIKLHHSHLQITPHGYRDILAGNSLRENCTSRHRCKDARPK